MAATRFGHPHSRRLVFPRLRPMEYAPRNRSRRRLNPRPKEPSPHDRTISAADSIPLLRRARKGDRQLSLTPQSPKAARQRVCSLNSRHHDHRTGHTRLSVSPLLWRRSGRMGHERGGYISYIKNRFLPATKSASFNQKNRPLHSIAGQIFLI